MLKRKQRDPVEDAIAFAWGAVLGVLLGGGLALFLAPSDGPTLRRRLAGVLGMADDGPPAAGLSEPTLESPAPDARVDAGLPPASGVAGASVAGASAVASGTTASGTTA